MSMTHGITGPTPAGETLAAGNFTRATLARLETEITELWGQINAATYRFLELVAAFDKLEGWSEHGCASCAHWLNWQCGIGPVAAREKVRVARSLETLPAISDAFRRGVLSYSKVRAMTRVATPANEAALLGIAEHGTAAHIERLVRKYEWVGRRAAADRAMAQHASRYVRYRYHDDGSVVIEAKLPPEVAEIVRKALDAAMDMLETDDTVNDTPAASALNEIQTHSNVSAEAQPLPAAPARRPDTGSEREPPGARRADGLRLLAEGFLAQRQAACGSTADRFQVVVHVDQRLLADCADGPPAPIDTEDPAECGLDDGRRLAVDTARRLGCDASLVGMLDGPDGTPLSVGRKTRSIPPSIARALSARDGGCRYPGCDRQRFTEGHHIRHWADGGETRLDNLITLCRHHHRLLHEGGFGLRVLDDGAARDRFVFLRPDGTRVEPNGRQRLGVEPAPAVDGDPPLRAANRARGVEIDAATSRCGWGGEPLDYGLAVDALLSADGLWEHAPWRSPELSAGPKAYART